MPLKRARLQSEDGATAVLFALVLPVLLALMAFATEVLALAGAERELQRTADQAALTAAAQIPLVNLGGLGSLDSASEIIAALTPSADSPLDDACVVASGNAQQSGLLTGFAREIPTCDNAGIVITPVIGSPSLVSGAQALFDAIDDELTIAQSLQNQLQANAHASQAGGSGASIDLDGSTTAGVVSPPPIATTFDMLAALGLPVELGVLAPALTVSHMDATAGAEVSTPLRTLISDDAFSPAATDARAQRRFKNVLLLPIIDLGCTPQPIRLTNEVLAAMHDQVGSSEALAAILVAYGLVVEQLPDNDLLPDLPEDPLPEDPPTLDEDLDPDADPDPSVGDPDVDPDPDPDVDPDPAPQIPDPQPANPEPPSIPEAPEPEGPDGADGTGDSGGPDTTDTTGTRSFRAAQLDLPEEVQENGSVLDDLSGTGDDLLENPVDAVQDIIQPYIGMVNGQVTDIDAFLQNLVPGATLPVTAGGTLADPPGTIGGLVGPVLDPLVGPAIDDVNQLLRLTGMVGQLDDSCEINLNEVVTPVAVERMDEVLLTLQNELAALEPTLPGASELSLLIADARLDLMDLLDPGTDAPTAAEILAAASSADEDILLVTIGSTQIPALDFMIRPAREVGALVNSAPGLLPDPGASGGHSIDLSGEVNLRVSPAMLHGSVTTAGSIVGGHSSFVSPPDISGLPTRLGSLLTSTTSARGLFRATLVD